MEATTKQIAEFLDTQEPCLGDCGFVGTREQMHPGRNAWGKHVREGYYCDACVPLCGYRSSNVTPACREPYWRDSLGGFCVAHEIEAALTSYKDARIHNDWGEMKQAKAELERALEESKGTTLEARAREALLEIGVRL